MSFKQLISKGEKRPLRHYALTSSETMALVTAQTHGKMLRAWVLASVVMLGHILSGCAPFSLVFLICKANILTTVSASQICCEN